MRLFSHVLASGGISGDSESIQAEPCVQLGERLFWLETHNQDEQWFWGEWLCITVTEPHVNNSREKTDWLNHDGKQWQSRAFHSHWPGSRIRCSCSHRLNTNRSQLLWIEKGLPEAKLGLPALKWYLSDQHNTSGDTCNILWHHEDMNGAGTACPERHAFYFLQSGSSSITFQ